ncbi:hypothetical protein ZWY2020_033502 [Hordeum vulgare]|nr:hypothetical protein ZWY2020_033502 [Hordeum vulgare]
MLDSQAPWLAEGSIQIRSGAGRQGRRGSAGGRNATAMAGGSGAGGWGSGGARIGQRRHTTAGHAGPCSGSAREEEGADGSLGQRLGRLQAAGRCRRGGPAPARPAGASDGKRRCGLGQGRSGGAAGNCS